MNRTVFILVLLVAGIAAWWYLSSRNDLPKTERIIAPQETPAATKTEKKPAPTPAISPDAPPQTDYGMEFPIVEE